MVSFSSCLKGDDDRDYSEWRTLNARYIENAETETEDGNLLYEKIIPGWDTSVFTLMRWHLRGTTPSAITPFSNSTVAVKYKLYNIEGELVDSSANFNCRPNQMITGFNVALTNMTVGDSVTAIIPYTAGYGTVNHGAILPYSTLIFEIKLDSILGYEKPGWR